MATTEKKTTETENKTAVVVHTPIEQSEKLLEVTTDELKKQAEERLKSPELTSTIIDNVHTLGVAGEDDLILAVYLIGTSRLLVKPLAGLVMGESSAGKSYVISGVVEFFPAETVLKAHFISSKAFIRMEEGTLEHKFVASGERSRRQDEGVAELTRWLRQLISDGELNAAITVQDEKGGWRTAMFRQKGPISYVESTTLKAAEIFDEDRTRFILLRADESMEQTGAVINRQARSACAPVESKAHKKIKLVHHTMQRLLKPYEVIVPFATELVDCMPTDKVVVRRTFPQMLGLIKATALLHQFQRDKDNKGRVIATIEDYNLVRERFSDIIARSIGDVLSHDAVALHRLILNQLPKLPKCGFSVSDFVDKVNYSETKLRSLMHGLVNAGQIIKVSQGHGRQATRYFVPANRPPLNALALPGL